MLKKQIWDISQPSDIDNTKNSAQYHVQYSDASFSKLKLQRELFPSRLSTMSKQTVCVFLNDYLLLWVSAINGLKFDILDVFNINGLKFDILDVFYIFLGFKECLLTFKNILTKTATINL